MDKLKKISATAFTREQFASLDHSKMIFDLENYRCCHYFSTLKEFIYEKLKKWVMLVEKYNFTEEQLSKTRLLSPHVASEVMNVPFNIEF